MKGFGSILRQLVRDLASQKLRTLLTTLGIVWGTVAVCLLLAFGFGLLANQRKSMAGMGDRIVIAWPARTSKPWQGVGKGRRIRVDQSDIRYLEKSVPGIKAISGEYNSQMRARYGTKVRIVNVSGVFPAYGPMRNMIPQEGGRFIDPIDMAQQRRVVFVGNKLADDLFGSQKIVGKTVMLHGSPFLVIGVLKPKEQNSAYSGRDHSKMVIPASTFHVLTGRKYFNDFIFKANRPALNKTLTKGILAALGAKLHFDPTDEQAISVWDTTEMFTFMDTFMFAFNAFLGLMGMLTLVVGGIGVTNIMSVVVDERTREIGIKMALGAKRRLILGQFLLETMALTIIGGAIGLGIAEGICTLVAHVGIQDYVGTPVVSAPIAIVTAALLGLIGVIAGYFPARDAANLDPVIAMKM
ncbi:MAG: ABC transporter permease [Acidobacteria bacterium]|nr:ABC transporter permease [Acidobacteriota bacterium]